MQLYKKQMGRVRLTAQRDGDHCLEVRHGWNDDCPFVAARLGTEELHDLRYLIDRALEKIERDKRG